MQVCDRFRLLFFGSDAFSIRVLQPLLDRRLCPVQIVTKPHSLLDSFSRKQNLTRHHWHTGLSGIEDGTFNIGLVASFGQLIDPVTVGRFQFGLFNTHPSLLPQFRGSTPIQAAVLNGLQQTGCTIMRIPPVQKFDVGEIVDQRALAIRQGEYAIELRDRLADLGSIMVIDFLLNYELYLSRARPQGDQGKSLARKLKLEQGRLEFKLETASVIERKILAYTGSIELYTSCLGGLRVRLSSFQSLNSVKRLQLDRLTSNLLGQTEWTSEPGSMYFHKLRNLLCFKSADHQWVAFAHATPEGKAQMDAADFFNGYLSKIHPANRMTDI